MSSNKSFAHTAVVIPAYNEALTIVRTIEDFHQFLPGASIFVINNNSSDQTKELAQEKLNELNCGEVIDEPLQGKGNAIRKAFRTLDFDYYLMVDADHTYLAKDASHLLTPVMQQQADMVVGNRFAHQHYQKENKRPFHQFGNMMVKKVVNFLFKTSLADILSGYRAFNKNFIKNWPVMSGGFEIEVEMTLHCLDKRFKLREVPITYQDRPQGSYSKLNTYLDGSKVIFTILGIFKDYRPLLFFSFMSFICFALSLFFGSIVIMEYIETQYINRVPMAILATGLMILCFINLTVAILLDTLGKYQKFNYELMQLRDEK